MEKKFKSSEEIFEIIKRNNPFSNPGFYAMILNFCPYYYTKDKEDNNIHYGDSLTQLNARLLYLKILELKKNGNNKDEYDAMKVMFKNKEYDKLIKYFYENPNLSNEKEHMNIWMYYSNDLLGSHNPGFSKNDIKYRLYLNVNVDYRAFFSKKIIEFFEKNKISYFFKDFTHKGQTDNVVLYIDSEETLLNTINGINEILEINPEYKKYIKDVPPHLCKINDYIGYGFNPSIHNGYERELSYTQFIQECEKEISNDFRHTLRKKIIADISVLLSKTNSKPFEEFTKREQYEFFINKFPYIYSINKNEIDEMHDIMRLKFDELKSKKNKKKI